MSKIVAEDFNLKKENKKDFKKSVIERVNLTNDFTIEDIENHQRDLEKMAREATAQIRVTKAAIDNVGRNHKFVSKMSDEQLNAAHYLWDAKTLLRDTEKKLKSVTETKKKYAQILSVIYGKFGFVESNVIADGKESNEG